MQALIDPTSFVQYVASWATNPLDATTYVPVMATYPNSARVCQVQMDSFEIAAPLFWTVCANDVMADEFWFSTVNSVFTPVVNAPYPS
jgi:hypothetical protein